MILQSRLIHRNVEPLNLGPQNLLNELAGGILTVPTEWQLIELRKT